MAEFIPLSCSIRCSAMTAGAWFWVLAASCECRLPCKVLMQAAACSKLAVDLQVGSMEDAKTALREAVQLPLQHPHLFAQGSLARCGLQTLF